MPVKVFEREPPFERPLNLLFKEIIMLDSQTKLPQNIIKNIKIFKWIWIFIAVIE